MAVVVAVVVVVVVVAVMAVVMAAAGRVTSHGSRFASSSRRSFSFSSHSFCRDNPSVFAHQDTALTLSFSLMMLNTDLHSQEVKTRMTKEQHCFAPRHSPTWSPYLWGPRHVDSS